MKKPKSQDRFTIRFCLITAISALIILSAGLATVTSYLGQKRSVSLLVADSLIRYKDHVVLKALHYVEEAAATIHFCREAMEADIVHRGSPVNSIRYFERSIDDHPQFSAFRFCRSSGDCLMVKRMPDNTKSLAITELSPDSVTTGWTHANRAWTNRFPETIVLPRSDDTDPRTASWYTGAVARDRLSWTDIYIFPSDGQPGITCSIPIHSTNGTIQGVMSIDIALSELADFMRIHAMPGSTALIATEHGDIVSLVSLEQNPKSSIPVSPTSILNLESLDNAMIRKAMRKLNSEVIEAVQRDPAADTERLTYSFEFSQSDRTYLASFARFPEKSPWKWTIGIIVPQDIFLADVRKLASITFSTCGFLILLSLAFGYHISHQISAPLSRLDQQMARVKDLDLRPSEPIRSRIAEVDNMARSFDNMVAGLRSFRKYVPAELVRQLISLGSEARLGGEKRHLTIYFSDIADFTSISERMPPEMLVEHLCEYFSRMSETVKDHGGTVDKYIGDAIMAFWGAPAPLEDHALEACKTALENMSKLERMSASGKMFNVSAFRTRIGINTGEVIVANIGSELRMNYTVIGDHVNVASRLEGLNKMYGTRVLISESTYALASSGIEARAIDVVAVKGRSAPIRIYELLSLKGELDSRRAAIRELYESGLNAYLAADFQKAIEKFGKVLEADPTDQPGKVLLQRSLAYRQTPPPTGWKGVYEHTSK